MSDPQAHVPNPVTTNQVKRRLLNEHVALEQLLALLTRALEGDDSANLCEVWTRFERNLQDHLDAEEQCLFPLVLSAHRCEVEQLRDEHQHIRGALSELGIAVDLHALRKASVDELIDYLQRHAVREEHSLYDWIDDDMAARRGLPAMLERRARHEAPALDE